MDLQLSSHVVARLVANLAKPKLSPVAQAAAKHEPRLKSLLFRSAKNTRDAVPMRELESVLIFGGSGAPLYVLEDALKAWERELLGDGVEPAPTDWIRMRAAANKNDLPSVLNAALQAGAHVKPIVGMAFDIANPEATAWAERHAAKLVTDITTEARAAIRTVVSDSFQAGMAPRETAKMIRSSIGLTEKNAQAVMNKHLKMLADGVDSAKAVARSEKYANKLLRSRAQTIARTELMKASNEGQQQLWAQARGKGLLDATAMKVWITADPCDICAPMEGETVPVDGTFSIGFDPPAHPNCRCTVGLV